MLNEKIEALRKGNHIILYLIAWAIMLVYVVYFLVTGPRIIDASESDLLAKGLVYFELIKIRIIALFGGLVLIQISPVLVSLWLDKTRAPKGS